MAYTMFSQYVHESQPFCRLSGSKSFLLAALSIAFVLFTRTPTPLTGPLYTNTYIISTVIILYPL